MSRERILYTEIATPACLSYAQASESFSVAGGNECNYLLERRDGNSRLFQQQGVESGSCDVDVPVSAVVLN